MAKTLLDLAIRLEAKAKSINVIASDKAVAVALKIVETLAYRTPVDTSTALSNWQVSLNAPKTAFINAYHPGYLGYTLIASAQATIQAAQAALAQKKPGQTIYIANNAPYIRDLNAGTSKQAPAGFVEASVLIARKSLRK